jgi:hypothetical protein
MNEFIVEEFKGYSTFVEITNPMLKAYNQYNVLSNMREAKLFQLMEDYLANLTQEARVGLYIITEYIRAKGIEETKRELIANGVAIG